MFTCTSIEKREEEHNNIYQFVNILQRCVGQCYLPGGWFEGEKYKSLFFILCCKSNLETAEK